MCHGSCLEFSRRQIVAEDVAGKRVIEVGSFDVNGSPRAIVEALGPAEYVGVDIELGPGVDEVCRAEHLIDRFGAERFDLVISTEMLEHVYDWRGILSNLKNLLAPGGVLLVTTRSLGCPHHGYPFDFWRYEIEDVAVLFADLQIEAAESDPELPGIFVRARRGPVFSERPLGGYRLHSMIKGTRADLSYAHYQALRLHRGLRLFVSGLVPGPLKRSVRRRLLGRSS